MNAVTFHCPIDEYHAMKGSWSHSQIEVLIESPPLFHGQFITGDFPMKRTNALDAGTIVHAALLEPDGLDSVVSVIPESALNEDGHRKGAAWLEWSKAQGKKIFLKNSEADPIFRMVENVRNNSEARRLLESHGPVEQCIQWLDEVTGLTLRARLDKIAEVPLGIAITDLKTTRAVKVRDFMRDAVTYGYHRQAAWYMDGAREIGLDPIAFLWITVDKSPAHECLVHELHPDDIELGRQHNRQVLRELEYRLATDDWTGRGNDCILLSRLPAWAHNLEILEV